MKNILFISKIVVVLIMLTSCNTLTPQPGNFPDVIDIIEARVSYEDLRLQGQAMLSDDKHVWPISDYNNSKRAVKFNLPIEFRNRLGLKYSRYINPDGGLDNTFAVNYNTFYPIAMNPQNYRSNDGYIYFVVKVYDDPKFTDVKPGLSSGNIFANDFIYLEGIGTNRY